MKALVNGIYKGPPSTKPLLNVNLAILQPDTYVHHYDSQNPDIDNEEEQASQEQPGDKG